MQNDAPPDETRMRASLGLLGGAQPRPSGNRPPQNSHRHRFVREGEVAVTVVNPAASDVAPAQSRRGLQTALEDALAAERASHMRTKRALEETLARIQALETKHAHRELAHAEAIRQEQTARAQVEAALQQLQTQLQQAEERERELAAAAAASKPRKAAPAASSSGRVTRPRQKASDGADPKPVKWWLPSYRTGKGRR